jgi:hypothetical protein
MEDVTIDGTRVCHEAGGMCLDKFAEAGMEIGSFDGYRWEVLVSRAELRTGSRSPIGWVCIGE